MSIILHIARQENWEEAQASGLYRAGTLMTEGFIHCSTPEQVVGVANTWFRGQRGLVLLCIDTEALEAEVRYENLESGDELFPHAYGPLNLEAVVRVLDFEPQADGAFALPEDSLFDGGPSGDR
jgi:uncharacterized protein (DUF952 family)